MSHTGLAIAECRWWHSGNDSVRPLFETLAGIIEGNPHSVRYDMFSEENSLRYIISDIASLGQYHSLYIASHGSGGAVSGLGSSSISRTVLRNIFRTADPYGTISGIYFGSCLVGNQANAGYWLDPNMTNLKWVAGYTQSVDWVDSSAIDMIFWSKYLSERKTNRSRRGRSQRSEIQMVQHAASEMKRLMPNVFTIMGFNIYHLDTGGTLTPAW